MARILYLRRKWGAVKLWGDYCGENYLNILEQDLDEAHLKNKELQDLLEITTKQYNSLLKRYNEILQLAKENADSNEYVIQELEKENEKLKEILILSMWNKKE